MLEAFNLSRQKVAILQNAFNITEKQEMNSVYQLEFSLPATDDKNKYCVPYSYVRYNDGHLYRIITPVHDKGDSDIIRYRCEHVIATLIDDVLFGAHIVGNLGVYTADSINYVLNHQSTRNWVLDTCDFTRQFEYGWENENLLTALFSIPNRFTEPYIWQYNTHVYPWKLSLKKIDTSRTPQFYLRAGKNLLNENNQKSAGNICTRLYCLGYGEGVNQLTISDINGGKAYLQSPQEYINKYGLISRIWVDRRFEDAQSLKERGQAILNELQEPQEQIEVSAADLYQQTEADYDKAEVGRIVLLAEDNTKTYITGVSWNHDIAGDMSLTIANKPTDIVKSIADLADRQRIEQVYSQGATQLYAQSVQANATPQVAAVLNFWLPNEMRIINKVLVKITLAPFRSYSKATQGGGAVSSTSSEGGNYIATSSAGGSYTGTSAEGGGSISTSAEGGGSTATSSAGGGYTGTSSAGGGDISTSSAGGGYAGTSFAGGGVQTSGSATILDTSNTLPDPDDDGSGYGKANHNHGIVQGTKLAVVNDQQNIIGYVAFAASGKHEHPAHTHEINIPQHSHGISIPQHYHSINIPQHSHGLSIPNHFHTINIPKHTHDVKIPKHKHDVKIPNHTHNITIPKHTHNITLPDHTHQIEQGIFTFGNAQNARIVINGVQKGVMNKDAEFDITEWLLDSNNKIPRGQWQKIEIYPNDLAYITVDLYVQGFVQSRGGGTH